MELRGPQRLVGVDVPDAGHERLVEQERLQPQPACGEALRERLRREPRIEGLGPEALERPRPAELAAQIACRRISPRDADAPELADVPEPELASVLEGEHEPDVGILRRA